MTHFLLVDPTFGIPPSSSESSDWAQFWIRLMEWEQDPRVKVGPNTYVLSLPILQALESSLADFPPHTRRDRKRTIPKLLSRIAEGFPTDREIRLIPSYAGPPEAATALLSDIAVTGLGTDPTLAGLATIMEHWPEAQDCVCCEPEPPQVLQLCLRPNAELDADRLLAYRDRLSGKRLRIVGAQPETRIVSELLECFDFEPDSIDWLACERHKKAPLRNWVALDPNVDIVICVTSRIGHADSKKAQLIASRVGCVWIPVGSTSEIRSAIERFCRTLD